jgi:hypothetical protein
MNDNDASLELMIDLNGIDGVLAAMAAICAMKADHVRQYADSEYLAREWERAGRDLDRQSERSVFRKLGGK